MWTISVGIRTLTHAASLNKRLQTEVKKLPYQGLTRQQELIVSTLSCVLKMSHCFR